MTINPKSLKNLKPCKPWQTNNPNGQPKRTITAAIEELKAQWFQEVKKVDVQAAWQYMMWVDHDTLKAIWADKTRPMIIRIVAKQLLSSNDQAYMLERMLDRVHGRATQKIWWDDDLPPVAVRVILPQAPQE